MRDSKGNDIQYQRVQTRLTSEDKESDVLMQNVCIKIISRVFRTRAALTIHQKQLHRDLTNAPVFVCPNCGDEFKQKGSMKNHCKGCGGERTVNQKKECKNCMKQVSRANFASYRISCQAR